MRKCLIIGAGTYGQVYAQYLKELYDVVGFIDDDLTLHGLHVMGYKVLGDSLYLFNNINKDDVAVFVPIGNNEVRLKLLIQLNEQGFLTPSFIHESALIHESVKVGKAVYILPGVNIMPCTVIKDFVMISMGVNIAHHTIIEEGCFFSQGTNIGASVNIKRKAYFGISSTLMTGVKEVGEDALVGAGAVVIKNVPDHAVLAGVPAKVLRYK